MATAAAPAAPAAPPVEDEQPVLAVTPFQRAVLTAAIILGTMMQVIDSTIANVALPHMSATFGATPDTITWVLTSYIVASAVATPVAGWLADRFGRRAMMLATIAGFTAASALCGVAQSLGMMVAARLLQGAFGAFILPLGQALILDINPRSKHAQALMVWGMAAMIAPVMGPVLGGWLTERFDWRWVFFINVPFGAAALAALLVSMPRIRTTAARFDYLGFSFLIIGVASLQLMLDRGPQQDWFSATEIVVELGLAMAGLWAFTVHTMTAAQPLMPRALFRDRNLVLSTLFVTLAIGLLIVSSAMLPPLLQQLMGHDAYSAGLATAPRGIGMLVSMTIAGRLANHVDPRALVLFGLVVAAFAVHMMIGFELGMDSRPVVISGFIQGLGIGFISLPMNLLAFSTIDPALRTGAAGLYGLARNLGGSIGIAAVTALMAREIQVSHADLAKVVTDQAVPLQGLAFGAPYGLGYQTVLSGINAEINRQAAMIGYLDAFTAMFWVNVAAIPLVFFMRLGRRPGPAEPALAID